MKIAILTDYILKRDYYTETVETLCELLQSDHDVEIYCFAHNEGQVLGPIEKSKIISTYLSHMILNEDDFYSRLHHIPKLADSFHVSCDTDLVVSVSRGFAQGIKIPEVKHICFVHDFNFKTTGFLAKILSPGVKAWIKKSFESVTQLQLNSQASLKKLEKMVDHSILKEKMGSEQNLYSTPIRLEDFPNLDLKREDLIVVDGNSLKNNDYDFFKQLINRMNSNIIVLGTTGFNRKQIETMTSKTTEFWGVRCSGETREVFGKAKWFVSFNSSSFPGDALCALAMKTPVVLLESEVNREFIRDESGVFLNSQEEFLKFDWKKEQLSEFNGSKLRNNALSFNSAKLKIKLKESIN